MQFRKVIAILIIVIAFAPDLKAGCTGLCISSDQAGTMNQDTLDLSAGPVNIYAHYNGACALIGFDTLVWFRDGLPFDTTTSADAVFDGVWTYTTTIQITVSGVYTVYPIQFIVATTQCGEINVMNGSITGISDQVKNVHASEYSMYPNPAKGDEVFISYPNGTTITEIKMFDMTGKNCPINIYYSDDTKITIRTSDMKGGTYIITVIDSAGNQRNFSLLIS